jgi:hypothetical protein
MDRYLPRVLLGAGEAEEIVSLQLQWGRSRGEGEGALGVDSSNQGVSGERGEIGKEATEAVDRDFFCGCGSIRIEADRNLTVAMVGYSDGSSQAPAGTRVSSSPGKLKS